MRPAARIPECHPDRKHQGHGLCNACYTLQYKKTWVNKRTAACHPERPHHAAGLCASCYVVNTPEKREANRAWSKKKVITQYGLTAADVDHMLTEQKYACAACSTDISGFQTQKDGRTTKRYRVDHCHATGAVRGLLCNKCNAGIGYFDDNPERLHLAAAYLRRFTEKLT